MQDLPPALFPKTLRFVVAMYSVICPQLLNVFEEIITDLKCASALTKLESSQFVLVGLGGMHTSRQ